MFDVNYCYWIVDQSGHINLASAPSARAPIQFSSGVLAEPGPPTPLSEQQAIALRQAAADMQQPPLTFLNSLAGQSALRRVLNGEQVLH